MKILSISNFSVEKYKRIGQKIASMLLSKRQTLNSLEICITLMLISEPSPGKGSESAAVGGGGATSFGESDKRLILFADYTKMLLTKLLLTFMPRPCSSYLGFQGCTFTGCHRNILKLFYFSNSTTHTHGAKLKRLQRTNHNNTVSFLSSSCLLATLFPFIEVSVDKFLISYIFYEYLYFGNNKTPATKCVSHMQLLASQ